MNIHIQFYILLLQSAGETFFELKFRGGWGYLYNARVPIAVFTGCTSLRVSRRSAGLAVF